MLIYNNRKEFVDATADTLSRVGYNSVTELHEDAIDFADLFENKPGFVHNFKNFSWIDFIIHSEHDNTKARIRCNGKIYESSFKIDTHFFTPGDESDKGFAIELSDLIVVGDDENSSERTLDESMSIQIPSQTETADFNEPMSMPDLSMPDETMTPISIPDLDVKEESLSIPSEVAPLDFDLDLTDSTPSFDEPLPIADIPSVSTQNKAPVAPTVSTQNKKANLFKRLTLESGENYQYDPTIAADELGLPSDLIDEFVGDFIVQAKKFRPDLEDAVSTSDFDNLQILSHKLKGVAANLRIEDALEVLTFINTNKDITKLQDHLDYLYIIVSQLEFGEETPESVEEIPLQEVDINIMPEPVEETVLDVLQTSPVEENMGQDLMPSLDEKPDDINMDLDIMPSFDAPSETIGMDLDILPLDMDIENSEPDIAPVMDNEPLIEDDLAFDLLSTNDESTALEMNFDEPSVHIEEEPFQSPQDEPLDIANEFNLNNLEESAINEDFSPSNNQSYDASKFDKAQATADLDIDDETLKSYVDDFVDQANALKSDLENALTNEDLEEVKTLATQLIGMSDSLHMTYASELLTVLQTTNDATQAIESAKELFIFIREL